MQGILLLLVGVTVLRLAVGGQYLFYVAEGMKSFLLASGVALLVFGGYTLWQAVRAGRAPAVIDLTADSHDHSHGPRVAYLLLLPVLAVYVVAPSALGAFSASRQAASSVAPAAQADLPALPAGAVADLSLRDYVIRAVWDDGRTLRDRDVRMVGFVTPDPAGGWWLTRMAMTCCAADAQASRIKVLGAGDLPADTWVELTGTWTPGGGVHAAAAIPLVRAAHVTPVAEPHNPYE